MKNIYLVSGNQEKRLALEQALKQVNLKVQVVPVTAAIGSHEHPLGMRETYDAARMRASSAYNEVSPRMVLAVQYGRMRLGSRVPAHILAGIYLITDKGAEFYTTTPLVAEDSSPAERRLALVAGLVHLLDRF